MKRAALLALLALMIRLPFLAYGPGGWDDVDFALGVRQYDVAAMQPHFPGYPVYILTAFLFGAIIPNPFLALSLLSAVACALTVFPLYGIVQRYSGERIAGIVAVLWTVNPLAMVLGTQPTSDSFGTLLALLLVASSVRALDDRIGERQRALALIGSGIWLGLLYGVRISYLPLGAVPLWAAYVYWRDTRRFDDVISAVASAILVSLLWIYALVVNVGSVSGLWQLALAFTSGHFSDWGGAYVGGSFMERLMYWTCRQWLAAGLGTPWPEQHWISFGVLACLFVSMAGWWQRRKYIRTWLSCNWREAGLLLMWVIPYLLWAFFAQNAEKPRHIFPLLIPLLWSIAVGLHMQRKWGKYVTFTLIVCMLGVSWTQVQEREKPSPMEQLAYYAATALPKSSVLYTYEEERVLNYQSPQVQTVRLRHWSDFRTSVLSSRISPTSIFLTDQVLDGFNRPELWQYVREKVRFTGSPWLYPTYNDIVLYEIRPDKREEWKEVIQNDN
jgi:4-amino-4-deoxy-L-arabinose transferase-like glycosyltransferase